jgi:hypothetical protein
METIHTAFFLAGMQCISESKTEQNQRVLVAQKKKNTAAATVTNSAAVVSIVKLDDENLIDEDALLGQEDEGLAPDMKGISTNSAAADDCGGREPCDNCTCGRAATTGGAATTQTTESVPTSSCGKCGLGVAFRCPTCPYLGLPAFKPGEEHLVLQLKDDL